MVLCDMFWLRFQILIVSSELHVTKEPGGKTGFEPSSWFGGYISRPQMQAEWKMNECDLPT